MAATILAKDVLYRVSAQLLDAPDSARQFSRWSEKELVAWLNDAQRVIAKYLPDSCSRVDVIKLATGSRQSIETIQAASIKHGDGSTSALTRGKKLLDVVRNMGSDGLSAGRAVMLRTREELERIDPRWHVDTGSEIKGYVHDPRTPKYFWTFPAVPSGTDVWVEVAMLANPTEVAYVADSMRISGNSTTVISLGDEYVDDIVNYMLARAHLKEAEVAGNAGIANAYANQFIGSINAQVQAATGVNPNLKALPVTQQPAATAS